MVTIGLRAVPKVGDSLVERFPDIAMEWDKELNSDAGISPEEISYLSNVKIWWRCPKGHIWNSRVVRRTNKGYAQCRSCESKNSEIEEVLRKAVVADSDFDYVAENEVPFEYNGYETCVDISGIFNNRKFIVEYDGSRWHKTDKRKERDLSKTQFFLDKGYDLVRVRENSLFYLDVVDPKFEQISYRHSLKDEKVSELVKSIKESLEKIHERS